MEGRGHDDKFIQQGADSEVSCSQTHELCLGAAISLPCEHRLEASMSADRVEGKLFSRRLLNNHEARRLRGN